MEPKSSWVMNLQKDHYPWTNPAGVLVGGCLLEMPLEELFPITEYLPEKSQEPDI